MEHYLPFLTNNWRTVGLIGASLATGVMLGKVQISNNEIKNEIQTNHSDHSNKSVIKLDKTKPINEATDNQDDEGDDDIDNQQSPDEGETSRISYEYVRFSQVESIQRSVEFYLRMNQRRSVRDISSDPVAFELIENIIKTAGKYESIVNSLT